MKRRLMEVLACPICKHYPLDLTVFKENEEIEEGIIFCSSCRRWYPVMETIPHMLPDDLRDELSDREFIAKWKGKIPDEMLKGSKPFNIEK